MKWNEVEANSVLRNRGGRTLDEFAMWMPNIFQYVTGEKQIKKSTLLLFQSFSIYLCRLKFKLFKNVSLTSSFPNDGSKYRTPSFISLRLY